MLKRVYKCICFEFFSAKSSRLKIVSYYFIFFLTTFNKTALQEIRKYLILLTKHVCLRIIINKELISVQELLECSVQLTIHGKHFAQNCLSSAKDKKQLVFAERIKFKFIRYLNYNRLLFAVIFTTSLNVQIIFSRGIYLTKIFDCIHCILS